MNETPSDEQVVSTEPPSPYHNLVFSFGKVQDVMALNYDRHAKYTAVRNPDGTTLTIRHRISGGAEMILETRPSTGEILVPEGIGSHRQSYGRKLKKILVRDPANRYTDPNLG